jgi:uncharacterized protein (DUF427 family)
MPAFVPLDSTRTHVEDCLKRVRALFGGTFIVDTRKAKLVWEHKYYPQYYFLHSELSKTYLDEGSKQVTPEDLIKYDIVVGEKRATEALTVYGETHGDLAGLFKVGFGSMDIWYEEDEQVFVHPKDPYKVCLLHPIAKINTDLDFDSVSMYSSLHDTFALRSTESKLRTRTDLDSYTRLACLCEHTSHRQTAGWIFWCLQIIRPPVHIRSCIYNSFHNLEADTRLCRVLQITITFRLHRIRGQRMSFGGIGIQIWNVLLSMGFSPSTMSV